MKHPQSYEEYVRQQITELRMKKDISEHRLSLELGKSDSYIRGITSGQSLPSLKELFNIIRYFGLTPAEFFTSADDPELPRICVQRKLFDLSDEDLEKVALFIEWIK